SRDSGGSADDERKMTRAFPQVLPDETGQFLGSPHLPACVENNHMIGSVERGQYACAFVVDSAGIVADFGVFKFGDLHRRETADAGGKVGRKRGKIRIFGPADPDDPQLHGFESYVPCPINSLTSRRFPARHSLSRS